MTMTSDIATKVDKLAAAIGSLTEQDEKLKSRFYLYHWLLGNKMDVRKAEEAIRANLKWRTDKNINSLLDADLDEELCQRFPCFMDTKTAAGEPLIYCPLGFVDIVGLLKEYGKERMLQYLTQLYVKMEAIIFERDERQGDVTSDEVFKNCKGFNSIYDTAGWQVKKISGIQAIQFYMDWTKLWAAHFPNICHEVHVINVSKFLENLYKLVKPLVSSTGLSITIHSNNSAIWDFITEQQLAELQARRSNLPE